MPTPDSHVSFVAAAVSVFINWAVSILFDIPPSVVFVAFFGAFIGLVFRPSVVIPDQMYGKFILFVKTLGWLVVITILAGWVVPLIAALAPNVAQKAMAALTGFILMVQRDRIVSLTDIAIDKVKRGRR